MSISSGSSQPGPFKSGQSSIDAGLLNTLWSGLKQNAPGMGNYGIRHRQSGGGTSYEVIQPRRRAPILPPFFCYIINGKLRVKPGAVNNVIPTLAGQSLSSDPPPEIEIPEGEQTSLEVVIKCNGSKNTRFPTTAVIEIKQPGQAAQDTDDYGYLLLATLQKLENGGWTSSQIVSGSVWAERQKFTEPDTAWYYFYRV